MTTDIRTQKNVTPSELSNHVESYMKKCKSDNDILIQLVDKLLIDESVTKKDIENVIKSSEVSLDDNLKDLIESYKDIKNNNDTHHEELARNIKDLHKLITDLEKSVIKEKLKNEKIGNQLQKHLLLFQELEKTKKEFDLGGVNANVQKSTWHQEVRLVAGIIIALVAYIAFDFTTNVLANLWQIDGDNPFQILLAVFIYLSCLLVAVLFGHYLRDFLL